MGYCNTVSLLGLATLLQKMSHKSDAGAASQRGAASAKAARANEINLLNIMMAIGEDSSI